MLGISFGEMAIIMAVALVVIGPEKLPEVIHTVGKMVGKVRHFSDKVRSEIEQELKVDELKKSFQSLAQESELDTLKKELTTVSETTEDAMRQAEQRFKSAIHSDIDQYDIKRASLELNSHDKELEATVDDAIDDMIGDFSDYYSDMSAEDSVSSSLLTQPPKNYQNRLSKSVSLYEEDGIWIQSWRARLLELTLEEGTPQYKMHQLMQQQKERAISSEEDIEVSYIHRTCDLNK